MLYQHDKPVTIFYSQGVHHHIPKGKMVFRYLTNIREQLCFGGYYLLSDEFIPNYANNEERELNLVIWYSHIISHALQDGFQYLAQEETKTLLDDLSEGQPESSFKTIDQINLVLSKVDAINHLAETRNMEDAKQLAGSLIRELQVLTQKRPSGNEALDLSRRDYKICDAVFRKEIEKVGFEIESVRSYGPLKHIGAMCVYVLRKN
jgi:hypothetical protein